MEGGEGGEGGGECEGRRGWREEREIPYSAKFSSYTNFGIQNRCTNLQIT